MKIVVTGAGGQLGSVFVTQARAAGLEVQAYSSRECDITQDLQLDLEGVDALINCAAYTAVDKAEDEPEKAFAINARGVENLAQLCKKQRVSMIHISTDYVFDGAKTEAYVETDLPHPQNVYGLSKLKGEEALQRIWEQHIILRVSWVFSRFSHNFVKTILRLSQERPQLKIVMDQIGSPTGATHIAQAILTMLQHPRLHHHWGIYHYSDTPLTNWYAFAKHFVDPQQCEILPITSAEYPLKAKRPLNSALNCAKIKRIFGIEQQPWQTELALLLHDEYTA